MHKQIIFLLIFSFLSIIPSISWAQTVTVTGIGEDRAHAINNAKRSAVQEVIGTYIDSRTLVKDAMVVLDEIYSKSYGFVGKLEIIEEGQISNAYKIKAKVDVNTNPDSSLLSQIKLVLSLNNPRIGIELTGGNNISPQNVNYCKGQIVEMLIKEGFSHVTGGRDNTDFIVEGEISANSNPILLPKYSDYTNEDSGEASVNTNLVKANVKINGRILKTDTNEIIGEFQETAENIRDTNDNAINVSTSNLAPKIAKSVKNLFARHGASVTGNVDIIARMDESKIKSFEEHLRKIIDVENVTMREFQNGKAIFHIETTLKPNQIYRHLKDAGVNIFLEKSSANILELSVN